MRPSPTITTLAAILAGALAACQADPTAVDAAPDAPPSADADAAPPDVGIDAAPDAPLDAPPSCLAANGWPQSTLPGTYVGEGYAVGNKLTLPGAMLDQHGNQVDLGQYYGAMVLVHVGAAWSTPDSTMDNSRQAREDALNASVSAYEYREITVLFENTGGGPATAADAATWATARAITGPVLAGPGASQFATDLALVAIPYNIVLDPTFQIRDISEGFGTDAALRTSVEDAFAAFALEHPAFVSTFCTDSSPL